MKKWFRFWFAEVLFSNWRWVRKWHGGHWELWWVDVPVASDIWHYEKQCTKGRERPSGLCRGTPTCEDWPER